MNFGDYVAGANLTSPPLYQEPTPLGLRSLHKGFQSPWRRRQILKSEKEGQYLSDQRRAKENRVLGDDSFDTKVRKNKIFEPARTNNQEGRNFLVNAAGYFGFFTGAEEMPITLEVKRVYTWAECGNYSWQHPKLHAKDCHRLWIAPSCSRNRIQPRSN